MIGLLQLVQGHGIGAEFAVVELNGSFILLAAMDGLDFFFALNLLADFRRGDGQANHEDGHEKQQPEQQIALLSLAPRRGNSELIFVALHRVPSL